MGCWRLFTLSGGAFGMHVSGSRGRVSKTKLSFALPPFSFDKLGREEVKGVPVFLYSQRWRFWYTCQQVGKASV